MKRTTYVALAAIALLALVGCGAAEKAEQAMDEATEVVQRDVLAEGLAAAKEAGVPLLVDVYSDT